MRKNFLLTALLGCGFTLAASADAATGGGPIQSIEVVGSQYALIRIGQISGSRPSCHNGVQQSAFAVDLSTNKGRGMLSTATAAFLAGREVTIEGQSTYSCGGTGQPGCCINTGTPYNNIEGIAKLRL